MTNFDQYVNFLRAIEKVQSEVLNKMRVPYGEEELNEQFNQLVIMFTDLTIQQQRRHLSLYSVLNRLLKDNNGSDGRVRNGSILQAAHSTSQQSFNPNSPNPQPVRRLSINEGSLQHSASFSSSSSNDKVGQLTVMAQARTRRSSDPGALLLLKPSPSSSSNISISRRCSECHEMEPSKPLMSTNSDQTNTADQAEPITESKPETLEITQVPMSETIELFTTESEVLSPICSQTATQCRKRPASLNRDEGKADIDKHLDVNHNRNKNNEPLSKKAKVEMGNGLNYQWDTLRLDCIECEESVQDESQLQLHFDAAHGGLMHRCVLKDCGIAFVTKNELLLHNASAHHELASWICYLCLNAYISFAGLHNHVWYYHQSGCFACQYEQCTYRATHRSEMCVHIERQHGNRKPKAIVEPIVAASCSYSVSPFSLTIPCNSNCEQNGGASCQDASNGITSAEEPLIADVNDDDEVQQQEQRLIKFKSHEI